MSLVFYLSASWRHRLLIDGCGMSIHEYDVHRPTYTDYRSRSLAATEIGLSDLPQQPPLHAALVRGEGMGVLCCYLIDS